jgi:hypothetical protein
MTPVSATLSSGYNGDYLAYLYRYYLHPVPYLVNDEAATELLRTPISTGMESLLQSAYITSSIERTERRRFA